MLKDIYFVAAGETDMKGDLTSAGKKDIKKVADIIKKVHAKDHPTVICYDNGFCESSCNLVCKGLETFSLSKWNKNQIYGLADSFTQRLRYESDTNRFYLIMGDITLIIVADIEFFNKFMEENSTREEPTLGKLPYFLMERGIYFHIHFPNPVCNCTYGNYKSE